MYQVEVIRQRNRRSAELDALGFGRRDSLRLPLADELPLILRYEGQNLQHQVGNEGAHQVLALPGIQQRHSNALCHRVPHLLLGADIYRADNIQRKQPQLHRQVRHSLQLLPHGTKRINTPRMIFTIIFQRIFPPLLCQTVVPSGKYSIMLCIRRRNARQVSSRLR